MAIIYSEDEKRRMSLGRVLTILNDRAERNTCDGECETNKPYKQCKECEAGRVLNEAGELLREAL